MSNKWIKKDDLVLVIAGNDRGKTGKVLMRFKDRILVQGVNIRKKHVKKSSKTQGAQIVSIERPIHISNVALAKEDGTKLKIKVKDKKDKRELIAVSSDGKEESFRIIRR